MVRVVVALRNVRVSPERQRVRGPGSAQVREAQRSAALERQHCARCMRCQEDHPRQGCQRHTRPALSVGAHPPGGLGDRPKGLQKIEKKGAKHEVLLWKPVYFRRDAGTIK